MFRWGTFVFVMLLLSGCDDDLGDVGVGITDEQAAEIARRKYQSFQAASIQAQDFLLVVDNSYSMHEEIKIVIQYLEHFFKVLQERRKVDYQVALVTTNVLSENGKLITGKSNDPVVSSRSQNALGEIKIRLEKINQSLFENDPNTGYEMGLEASVRARKEEMSNPLWSYNLSYE